VQLAKENLNSPISNIILESKQLERSSHGGMTIIYASHETYGNFTYIQADSEDIIVLQSNLDTTLASLNHMEPLNLTIEEIPDLTN